MTGIAGVILLVMGAAALASVAILVVAATLSS